MRASLRHPAAERRREQGARKRRGLRARARRWGSAKASSGETPPARLDAAAAPGEIVAARAGDLEVERVRAAGGPLDTAVYTCSCGYHFDAAVSTTVPCPHCGAEQAW